MTRALQVRSWLILCLMALSSASWSEDAKRGLSGREGRIAYACSNGRLVMVNSDGADEKSLGGGTILDRDRDFIASPMWSPDGSRIAYDMNSDAGTGNWCPEVVVSNTDGSGKVNISNDPGADRLPGWSPDGKRIAFLSNRQSKGLTNWDIYVANCDGSECKGLTKSHDVFPRRPVWTADSTQILFVRSGTSLAKPAECTHAIWQVNADTGNVTKLIDVATDPSSSPTDSRICFVNDAQVVNLPVPVPGETARFGGTFGDAVLVTGVLSMKTADGQVSSLAKGRLCRSPVWSPDGKQIAYLRCGFAPSREELVCELHVVKADGSNDRRLGYLGMWVPYVRMAWSPSCDEIVVLREKGEDNVTLSDEGKLGGFSMVFVAEAVAVNTTTGKQRRLAENEGFGSLISNPCGIDWGRGGE